MFYRAPHSSTAIEQGCGLSLTDLFAPEIASMRAERRETTF